MSDLKMTLRSREFPVSVRIGHDKTTARFEADLNGRTFTADTWSALRAKLLEETRKAAKTLDVRFTDSRSLEDGTVYAIHAGTGAYMVEWAGGGKKQMDSPSYHVFLRRLDDEEKNELQRLQVAEKEARSAVEDFTKARKIDLRATVRAALEAD